MHALSTVQAVFPIMFLFSVTYFWKSVDVFDLDYGGLDLICLGSFFVLPCCVLYHEEL